MRTDANASERPAEAGGMLTVLEAAARMRCSRTTVFGLIRDGHLPSIKPGRERLIAADDVDAYLTRLRTP